MMMLSHLPWCGDNLHGDFAVTLQNGDEDENTSTFFFANAKVVHGHSYSASVRLWPSAKLPPVSTPLPSPAQLLGVNTRGPSGCCTRISTCPYTTHASRSRQLTTRVRECCWQGPTAGGSALSRANSRKLFRPPLLVQPCGQFLRRPRR